MPSHQHTTRLRTRRIPTLIAFLFAIGLVAGLVSSSAVAQPSAKTVKPTIVLVHGAFADAGSWNGVTRRLLGAGYPVIAPAIPLRDLAGDSGYLASVLATIDGPVVLVGHSYGGAVITDAGTGNANVRALVYVAGFAPDAGESLADISGTYANSDLAGALFPRPYPLPDGTSGTDLYINPAMFKNVFAKDVANTTAAQMAVAQRPLSLAAFTATSGEPAWKSIPSWYMVATKDRAIDPDGERAMAARMGAHTVEVNSSHAVLVSHPAAVTALIIAAARATS